MVMVCVAVLFAGLFVSAIETGDDEVVSVDSTVASLCVCVGGVVTGGYLAVFDEHVVSVAVAVGTFFIYFCDW